MESQVRSEESGPGVALAPLEVTMSGPRPWEHLEFDDLLEFDYEDLLDDYEDLLDRDEHEFAGCREWDFAQAGSAR
jgi:hypothetical protein